MVCALLAPAAYAQKLQITADQGPYYVGEPFTLQVIASGFEEDPQPTCELMEPADENIAVDLIGVAPQVSESISIVNGRMKRERKVVHRFSFRVTGNVVGKQEIGSFVVRQGELEATSARASVDFQEIATNDDSFIQVTVPEELYVGQRALVTIRWGYAGNTSEISALRIYAPWFDQFEFQDFKLRSGNQALPIETPKDRLQLAAKVDQEEIDEKTFVVYTSQRYLLVDKAGEFELPPISASITTGGRRGGLDELFDDSFFFGRRRNRSPKSRSRAIGEPHRLEVKPLPIVDRPESFAGAVGEGFQLEVTANRSVVRVGDPITLQIRLQGDGNLPQASLPPLTADGGMSEQQFRLPNEDIAGVYADGAKEFNLTVRVNAEDVTEIPPLPFSWFNPETREYETTRSLPISLKVMPAQVVSSTDVVSNHPRLEKGVEDSSETSQAPSNPSRALSGLTTADLAIETDVNELLAEDSKSAWLPVITGGCYAAGFAVLGAGLWHHRRSQEDPRQRELRQLVADQQRRIERASTISQQDAAKEIAAALRKVLPAVRDNLRSETEAVIAQLDDVIYAPGDSDGLDDVLINTTRDIMQRIREGTT